MKNSGKKWWKLLGVFLFLAVFMPAAAVQTQAAEENAAGLVRKETNSGAKYYYYDQNGTMLKNAWKTVNGKRYYFSKNGYASTGNVKINGKRYVFNLDGQLFRPSKSKLVEVGKNKYYVDPKGHPQTGWLVIKNKLYYADKKGTIVKNKKVDGIKLGKTGAAKNDTACKLKRKTMSIVASITNSKMSKGQKLAACWRYVTGGRFRYSSLYYPNLGQYGWPRTTAYRMFTTGGGNCYGFACAFAALAREIGYDPYVIAGTIPGTRDGGTMTRHCWVKIGGGYYDPEAQFAGWGKGIYGWGNYDVTHTISRTTRFAS